MSQNSSRIQHVDGLRAVAVLSVLFYHATKSLPSSAWFFEGRHGVDLFFVISGFCLAYPILDGIASSATASFDVTSFFAKRVVRIVPPYYAAIAAFAALTAVLFAVRAPLPEMMRAISPMDILKQFLFLDYNPNFSNGSFWTLAVEARWYVLFPFIVWLWVSRRNAFWMVGLLSFVLYHFTRLGGGELPAFPAGIDFATLPAFMLGIVAAEMHVRRDPHAGYAIFVLPLLFLPTILIPRDQHVLQDTIDWQLISAALVLTVGHYKALARIFSWKPLAFIGVASYSIYLYHEPVIGTLENVIHIGWPAAAAASLAIGIIAWYTVERRLQLPAIKRLWVTDLKTLFVKVFKALDLPNETRLTGVAALSVPQTTPNRLLIQASIKFESFRSAVRAFKSKVSVPPAVTHQAPSQVGNFGIHQTISELDL